jgi:hypothetical protein
MQEEYAEAGKFLDRLTERMRCARTAVRVIPGNHDIHRGSISKASELMLSQIADKGADSLDAFLEDEQDREVLYRRLRHYRKFAEAYDCPLDGAGGIAGEQVVPLAPDRALRFIGLNSALSCGKNDERGRLILGAKQWVLPRNRGEELIVLCHHPLHWFRDSNAALKYVQARARVFISGHEHTPSFSVLPIESACDLLMLSAGATTPPKQTEIYKYTYNIIEFEWDRQQDGLQVRLYPRIWGERTRFEENSLLPGREKNPVVLGCPNFRAVPAKTAVDSLLRVKTGHLEYHHESAPPEAEGIQMEDDFPVQLLRFFRDLTGAQRLSALIALGALPPDWTEPLNQSAERRALDLIRSKGRVGELKSVIDEQIERQRTGETTNG